MAPRRILLTGARGFVGTHLRPVLAAAFPAADVLMPEVDVVDAEAVQAAVRALLPDACVHLAAVSAVPAARADPSLAWQVNLHGTLGLARALLAEAPGATLLFVSTAEIYGASFAHAATPSRGLDETAVAAPANTYAATKAAADLALGAMVGDGLRVIRVRPFNHTGPGQSDAFAVPAFARQIARIAAGRQAPVLSVGALDAARDFLDVRDVCAAYAACLSRAETLPPGAILNIASGTPRRIGDVLRALIDLSGLAVEIRQDPARVRPSEIPVACGNAARARELLDWAPRIAWETTLRDVLADWRARVVGEA